MSDTIEAAFMFFMGILLGAALGMSLMNGWYGVDNETTYVCAPLVSGEQEGHIIIDAQNVEHNCRKA